MKTQYSDTDLKPQSPKPCDSDINSNTFTPSANWPFPRTLPNEKEVQRRLRMRIKHLIKTTEAALF